MRAKNKCFLGAVRQRARGFVLELLEFQLPGTR